MKLYALLSKYENVDPQYWFTLDADGIELELNTKNLDAGWYRGHYMAHYPTSATYIGEIEDE